MPMIAVIDTSSLLSLARYYLPNDKNQVLFNFIKNKLISGELIILDEVLKESSFIAQKQILKSLPFLSDKKFLNQHGIGENTDMLIPPAPEKFYRMVNHNFAVKNIVAGMPEEEYEALKKHFLDSADCKMIIKCKIIRAGGEECLLITEESMTANDQKAFHKIPKICKMLNIDCCNIQEYFERVEEIKIEIR